jgi:hypothetical protein
MDQEGRQAESENAESVISALSAAKTPVARITFLTAHKALHLGVRTQPSGTRKYVVVRRPAGSTKLVIVTLCPVGRGEKYAVKQAVAVNAAMDRGVNPNAEKKAARQAEHAEKLKAKHTLHAVGQAYIARCKRHGRSDITMREYQRILDGDDLKPWHARPIGSITAEEVERLVGKVRERTAKGKMANSVYKFLRGAMSHALSTRVLAVDPLAHFDREEHLTKERSRKRSLVHPYTGDMSELLALYRGVDAIDPPHHPARALAKILILTGLRVGTLARVQDNNALMWKMVKDLDDAKRARLEIPWELRKTGEEGDDVQIVPLVPAAVAILQGLAKVGKDAPVFTSTGSTPLLVDNHLRDRYRELADAAAGRELEHWVVHDIRRSLATGLGFLACPPAIIDEILDHASEAKAGIRGVYDLSARVELRRDWLQRWADHLENGQRR